jgi:hypothetical protein
MRLTSSNSVLPFCSLQLLRGDDVIGSTVRIKLAKADGRVATLPIVRASVERLRAIGQLFLMLSEVHSDCVHHKMPSAEDIDA